MTARTFVMAGGGTGGHVIPALAVAEELKRRGHKAIFIGTRKGLESKLVPEAGFRLDWIDIEGIKGLGLGAVWRVGIKMPQALQTTRKLLRREEVAAVFSMGGFVAGPTVLAAATLGVPVVVMEPNAMPGLTNRRMAGMAYRALVVFEEAGKFFRKGKWEVCGLPVREEFFHLTPKPFGNPFTVLVSGGSRGSRTLNNAARVAWRLAQEAGMAVRWIHQCGVDMFAELAEEFRQGNYNGKVTAFVDNMPEAFAESDVIICRSGAGAVSELAAAGKASVLVPFPFAADQHQLRNAEAMQRAGASRLVLDQEMDGARMLAEIKSLGADAGALIAMGDAARRLARPDALKRACDVLENAAANA